MCLVDPTNTAIMCVCVCVWDQCHLYRSCLLFLPGVKKVIVHACCFVSYSERLKNDELSAAKKEEESKLAREKMREEQRRRREAVSRV